LCAAFAVLALAAATPADELRPAQDSYRERGDYASLRVIAKHLRIGMTRNEVHTLLGEPGRRVMPCLVVSPVYWLAR
jgi:outer membrane protein assembly factor BamE (lipoprotein component of BamABCDE complex)